jgi:hypothetical protein
MKRVRLLEGAPPLDELSCLIRIEVPVQFKPDNWKQFGPKDTFHGKVPTDVVGEASELMAGIEQLAFDIVEMLEGEGVTEQVVFVDSAGKIWSEIVEADEDSTDTLTDEQAPRIASQPINASGSARVNLRGSGGLGL